MYDICLGLNDEENVDYSEDVDENEDNDEMESDEEVEEEDSDNENNLNNDMSDLKEDGMSSDDKESNKCTKNTDKNKATELFAKKLKEKKLLMDEARKQLPYTFSGNDYK